MDKFGNIRVRARQSAPAAHKSPVVDWCEKLKWS